MTGPRFTFARKAAGAVALVILADVLFFNQLAGATIGLFALVWIAVIVAAMPAVLHNRSSLVALVLAALLALAQIEEPSLLGCALFLVTSAFAVLAARQRFDDAFRWSQRLIAHGVLGLVRPFGDAIRLLRLPRRAGRAGIRSSARMMLLPLLGGIAFVALFAHANPLIGQAFESIVLPSPFAAIGHLLFWIAAFLAIWPSLRPHPSATGLFANIPRFERQWPEVALPSILLSLVTFNLIFAVQNGLDIAFLWSGAALPRTVTLANYAHRGAYTLIATALLAGLFVLALLRPGSVAATSPAARRLVVLWVAQNLLLVASSILRTIDYVEAYSLTVFRIAALLWMGLVAIGLVLVCWRLLSGRSARWLINANSLAAAVVLLPATAIDLGAIAADWNVRHARETGGAGAAIDLCYLHDLGPAALLPLIDLERSARQPALRDRATFLRAGILADVVARDADWHQWSWRNARRLAAARIALGPNPARPKPAPDGRECDGTIVTPPAAAPVPPLPSAPPLTEAPQR